MGHTYIHTYRTFLPPSPSCRAEGVYPMHRRSTQRISNMGSYICPLSASRRGLARLHICLRSPTYPGRRRLHIAPETLAPSAPSAPFAPCVRIYSAGAPCIMGEGREGWYIASCEEKRPAGRRRGEGFGVECGNWDLRAACTPSLLQPFHPSIHLRLHRVSIRGPRTAQASHIHLPT